MPSLTTVTRLINWSGSANARPLTAMTGQYSGHALRGDRDRQLAGARLPGMQHSVRLFLGVIPDPVLVSLPGQQRKEIGIGEQDQAAGKRRLINKTDGTEDKAEDV